MHYSFTSLSTKDLAALSQRTISICNEPAYAVVKNYPLLTELINQYELYDKVYVKKIYSGKGQQLSEADTHRDASFNALKSILYGHTQLAASEAQQVAKDLYNVIGKYGFDLYTYKYAEETAQLKKLFEELTLPDNLTKIDRLQLTPVVTELTNAQQTFEKIFNDMAGENAELRLMNSASSQRRQLESALRNFLNVVRAMNQVAGWRELYAKLDEVAKAAFNSKTAKPTVATEAK